VSIDGTKANGHLLSFSSFELDLRAGELRKHGYRIKLQEQPFQILALLLEKPGEVVTREQLRERLWSADTFVDFDQSLNSAVKKLRQALNDDPDLPRFIETVPRRGYRFIFPLRNWANAPSAADVESSGANGGLPASESVPGESTPAPVVVSLPHWKLWAAGAAGFVLAVALLAWLRPAGAPTAASTAPIRLVPLTTFSGAVSRASFSPDGNQIAFAWEGAKEGSNDDHGVDIYIKQIGSETPLPITHDFGFNFIPQWSPDGRYIAFVHAGHNERPGIYIVPALGGPPRKLRDFEPNTNCRESLSWSPDEKYLIYADAASDQPCSVFQLNVENLSVRQITTPPVPSSGDWDAQYSPDGRSIAFIRNTKDVEDIYVMPAGGGEPKRVTFDNRLMSGMAWTPNSRELIFSSNRGGASWGLWRTPATGGTPERVVVGSDRAYAPTISLRGNRLIYASGFWNENIWRVPISPDHHAGKAERLIYSSMQEEGPQYSPDGKRIVFQSTRSGNFEIWRCDADGSNLVQLTSFNGPLTGTPRWSWDGKHISFDTRPGPHPNVHVISSDGGPARRFVNDKADEGVASWSHDGKWIYFASNRSGAWQVWRRPADGGEPVQITRKGGFAALESPDGKTLYYAKFDENGIWQVPVTGGDETEVVNEPPAHYWGYFAVGRDGLYYIGDTGTGSKHRPGFKFFDFATRKITAMGDMEKNPFSEAPGFSVSPDGRFILYVQLDEARNSLMLAENFR
jgi:Tol biopolymer transport system component/DNA-binding winged helix-turn-helix (wHTH) protein